MNFNNTLVNAETEAQAGDTASDYLIAQTPFHLGDDWEFVTENANPSCSHAEIETLIQKRIINLIDLEIMKVLAAYHYINHHNLLTALSSRLHPGYHKTSYLDNIRKLKKAGILLSYRPVHRDEIASGSGTAPLSPVRLYCLSQGAYTYIEHISPDAHPLLPSSARRKMELAAAGQFLIQFQSHYKEKIVGWEYQKKAKLGNVPFLLDALIRYHTTLPGQQEQALATLLLLSIRRYSSWEKQTLSRLHLLRVWLSRHESECMLPLPVLLVEDITMATALYAEICARESLSMLTVYFCTDSLLIAYPPLQTVYRCETDEEGRIIAVRTILDQS